MPVRTRTHDERVRLAERAVALREEGQTAREIAAALGISRSYASTLYTDPDGSRDKKRRAQYLVECPDCGGSMGSARLWGADRAPERCKSCAEAKNHEDRHWTPDRIIAALREFQRATGRVLTATDMLVRTGAPSIERKLSPERIAEIDAIPADLDLPHPFVVAREFGSWSAAIKAAGMDRPPTGGAAHRGTTKERRKMRSYIVLSKNGHGWIPRETVEAVHANDAIQKVADGEGAYIAVPEQHWQERVVAPKTVFAVVEKA